MKKCTRCDEELADSARFCSACGSPQPTIALGPESAQPINLQALTPASDLETTHAPSALRVTHYRLQVSAKILSWPRNCVCCMEEANAQFRAAASRTTGKRVQHTTTSWWDIPYCHACLAHKAKFDSAPWAFVPLALLGIVVWIAVSVAAENQGIGVLLGLPIALLGIWPYRKALQNARSSLRPSCTAEKAAVQYVSWHGSFHTFTFTSRAYLDRFVAANGRKTMSDIQPF